MRKLFYQYKTQLLLVLYGILITKVFYGQMGNGLDPSWSYALNKLTVFDNIKFGRDLVFTYGPLGFLYCPLYMNGNFIIGFVMYLLIWIADIILFYKILKLNKQNIYMLMFSLFLLYLGSPVNAADLYIQYSVLMAMAVLWNDIEDKFAVIFLVVITSIAFFFKFSIAIAVIGAYVLFIISKFLLKETKRIWIFFVPCVSIPICYLVYNPSIHDFFRFVKGSWEVSKGFNTAMSLPINDRYAFWMFVLMALYAVIMISQLVIKEQRNFYSMLWIAPCLFMSYKHGYVRADGHVIGAYIEILATFSIVILLFQVENIYKEIVGKSKKGVVQATLMSALLVIMLLNYNVEIHPWVNLRSRIRDISNAFYLMNEEQNNENVNSLTGIPKAIFEEIGDCTFTSYPMEITFIEKGRETGDGAVKNISSNFVPLFAVQMYSAYTPYLDTKTANGLRGKDAPEYIIFRFYTIDGRIALMEAPETWKAIQENYEIVMYDNETGYYLFRRGENTTDRSGYSGTNVVNKESVITFDGCSEAKIHAELSLVGQLTNLIWKIPEVKAEITYTDGTIITGRVLLNNLINGITISGMPYDYDTLYCAMNSDGANCTIENIKFSGEGLKYYKDDITVEYIYYDNPKQMDISYLKTDVDLSGLVKGDEEEIRWTFDSKTLSPLLSLNGWAVVTEDNYDYRIYVKIGEEYYAVNRERRQDVYDYFDLQGNTDVGFSINLPIGIEDAELILISGETYYEISF